LGPEPDTTNTADRAGGPSNTQRVGTPSRLTPRSGPALGAGDARLRDDENAALKALGSGTPPPQPARLLNSRGREYLRTLPNGSALSCERR
jgi:hypothetical protein